MSWIELSPKQKRLIAKSNRRLNLAAGAVRSGKSVGYNLRWIAYALHGPPGPVAMIGKTERTLTRNIIDPLRELLGDRLVVNYGKGEAYLGNRKIYLYGANDERAKDKIQGATLAGALCDEITTWPESFWSMLLSRLSVTGAQLFGTLNPDGPHHWLKTKYIDQAADLGIYHEHFELTDNPFLDPAFVESLIREYKAAGELWYKRYVLGLWVLAEGAVYDMFNEAKHVVECPTGQFDRFYVSIDFGAANPTAFTLFGLKGKQPPAYLIREYFHDGRASGTKTAGQYADDLKTWLAGVVPAGVIVDPSALIFIQELRARGYKVIEAKNDVLEGIRRVGQALSSGEFFIDRSCSNTIREFSGYVWDAKAQARGEDQPLKVDDHCMDAIRYFWFTLFGRDDWTYKPTSLNL